VLHEHLISLLPTHGSILDLGCGDGLLSSMIATSLPGARIRGMDVLVRKDAQIEVGAFDGSTIPLDDASIDTVLLVDVVHHTQAPAAFLREVCRVARRSIVIKDHTKQGLLAGPTLRFMDWIGNAAHGVALPYNYLTRAEWDGLFARTGLEVEAWIDKLDLYGLPGDLVFGRSLHFIARLKPRGAQ
jgi:SAM-dependent methyltransferase